MAGKAHPATQATQAYEEFEPFCKWQRMYDRDILEINLQDFKKDQLKVQISNQGILKISGERELGPSTKSKFYKEIRVPSDTYITGAIQAKFVIGWLYITMPKIIVVNPEKAKENTSEPSKIHDDQTPKQELAKDQPAAVLAPPPSKDSIIGGGSPKVPSTGFEFEEGKQPAAKVAMSLAATAAVVAVLVAYVVYMYKSTVD